MQDEAAMNHAVDAMLEHINKNHFASAKVSPELSVAFYESIAERCKDIAEGLREEHELEP